MSESERNKFSEAIKLERFKKKKSQEECSQILKISIPTYRELENNPNKMDLEQAIILGNFLEWNLLEFFLHDILQNAIKPQKE